MLSSTDIRKGNSIAPLSCRRPGAAQGRRYRGRRRFRADSGGQQWGQDDSHRHDELSADPVELGLVENLARPGGNVTGITNLSRELGGKRLELLKEAVPKLSRVAALYDPAVPAVYEVKEDLPVAARALGLTVQPWEVRAADDFDKVFAALSKQRPDGLYVPRRRANEC